MRKIFYAVLTAATAVSLSASNASAQTFVGSWRVDQGPSWATVPTAYSARKAAALLFGGNFTDYIISTVDNTVANIDSQGWYSTWGSDPACNFVFPCGTKLGQDFELSTNGLYADEGDVSAYVEDWAGGPQFTNYAFSRMDPVPEPSTISLLGVGLVAAFGAARRRNRAKKAA